MVYIFTMLLPRGSIGWKKSHILARDAKRMTLCGKAMGLSWWMVSLGRSRGLGTSLGTPFTMLPPQLFQIMSHCLLHTAHWTPKEPQKKHLYLEAVLCKALRFFALHSGHQDASIELGLADIPYIDLDISHFPIYRPPLCGFAAIPYIDSIYRILSYQNYDLRFLRCASRSF